ncbi:hypothetical protein QEN19_000121 [Hanseniaspora menglaensis]
MSLTYIKGPFGQSDNDKGSSLKRYCSAGNSFETDENYYMISGHKNNRNKSNNSNTSSSNTDSIGLDSQKYGHTELKNPSQNFNISLTGDGISDITRKTSVVLKETYTYQSIYDILHSQIITTEKQRNNLDDVNVTEMRRKNNKNNLLSDDFNVKDLSVWLLNQKKNTIDEDYACCQNQLKSMQECKNLTFEQQIKQGHVNKIKQYMTEYYKLLNKQNESTHFNPLRVIRDRELKLETETVGANNELKKLKPTTKRFQKLMKNYQNVIRDPPTIPVLMFTKRYDDEDNLSEIIGQRMYKSKNVALHPDKLNNKQPRYNDHLKNNKKTLNTPRYKYWKWFVGVNERYEDITIQKLIHLKRDLSGNSQDFSSIFSNNSDFSKDDLNSTSSILDDDLYIENASEHLEDVCSINGQLINSPLNVGREKLKKKIQDTINVLLFQKQAQLERIIYYEAVMKILITNSQRFQYANEKHLLKITQFETPEMSRLYQLLEDTVIEVPSCRKLTEISQNNELRNMTTELTTIQTEINTTLQLRFKKISMNEDQLNGNEFKESGVDGKFKKKAHRKNESTVTFIGFYIIELMIKFILVSIRVVYSIYSFCCFAKKD